MVVRLNRIVSIFAIDTAIDTRSIDTRDVYRKCSSDSFTFFFLFFCFYEYLENYSCPWVNIYEKKVVENHTCENMLENRWFGNETIGRRCNEIPGNVFVASLLSSELFDRSISTFMSRLSIPRYIVTPIQNIAVRIEKYRYSRYRLPQPSITSCKFILIRRQVCGTEFRIFSSILK